MAYSHGTVGRRFAPELGHTIDKNKMVQTTSVLIRHQGRNLTVQPDCIKGQFLCGYVFGYMP